MRVSRPSPRCRDGASAAAPTGAPARIVSFGGENASFVLIAGRGSGAPTTAMWVYRMFMGALSGYLLPGMKSPPSRLRESGLILAISVPDDKLLSTRSHSPIGWRASHHHLQMLKMLFNAHSRNMGLATSRRSAPLRRVSRGHTQEGLDFIAAPSQASSRVVCVNATTLRRLWAPARFRKAQECRAED